MKISPRIVLLFFLAILATLHAHAQGGFGGCGDSPENPTLLLAGLAGGAFAVCQIKTRIRARRKSPKTEIQGPAA